MKTKEKIGVPYGRTGLLCNGNFFEKRTRQDKTKTNLASRVHPATSRPVSLKKTLHNNPVLAYRTPIPSLFHRLFVCRILSQTSRVHRGLVFAVLFDSKHGEPMSPSKIFNFLYCIQYIFFTPATYNTHASSIFNHPKSFTPTSYYTIKCSKTIVLLLVYTALIYYGVLHLFIYIYILIFSEECFRCVTPH